MSGARGDNNGDEAVRDEAKDTITRLDRLVKMKSQQIAGLDKDNYYYKHTNRELKRKLKELLQNQARVASSVTSAQKLDVENHQLKKEILQIKTQYENMKEFLASHRASDSGILPIQMSRTEVKSALKPVSARQAQQTKQTSSDISSSRGVVENQNQNQKQESPPSRSNEKSVSVSSTNHRPSSGVRISKAGSGSKQGGALGSVKGRGGKESSEGARDNRSDRGNTHSQRERESSRDHLTVGDFMNAGNEILSPDHHGNPWEISRILGPSVAASGEYDPDQLDFPNHLTVSTAEAPMASGMNTLNNLNRRPHPRDHGGHGHGSIQIQKDQVTVVPTFTYDMSESSSTSGRGGSKKL